MRTKPQGGEQRFFIMRHGETEANATGRIQGSTNASSRLTDQGRAQAMAAGAAAFGETNGVFVDRVYISPLTRAKETLDSVREGALPGHIPNEETAHPDLTGIQLYGWEGQNVKDLREQDPEAFRAWVEGDANVFTVSGHKPVSEVWERAKGLWPFFRGMEEPPEDVHKSKNMTTLLVCHGTLSQALLSTAFGWDETVFRKHDFPNAGMIELLWEVGEPRASCWRWIHPKQTDWIYPRAHHARELLTHRADPLYHVHT